MSITESFTVTGMTCGHCVQAVTTEVLMVAGVERVDIDLESGVVSVTSQAGVAPADIAEAVEEAGYTVSS